MLTVKDRKSSSPFKLNDSSIFRIEIPNAASRSLLGSTAIIGQEILNAIKYNTGLSAANFTFPGSYNVLTHPLTTPQFRWENDWLESLTQMGYLPSTLIHCEWRNLTTKYLLEDVASEPGYFQTKSFEKIGSSDVSLSLYDAISSLREKYDFGRGVSSFLLKNEILVSFLKNAYSELSGRFPESRLGLEIKSDLEIDNWISLFLSINQLEVDDSIEGNFDDFIMNWMFKQTSEIKKLVTIVDKCY